MNRCRTCAVMILNPNAKNLFDEDDNETLNNIETLTGILLKEDQHMPKHICTCCHLDLYHAIAFRERCLKTEHFLQASRPKPTTGDPLNTARAEKESANEASDKLQCAAPALSENLIHIPDTHILSQHFPQSRILHLRKQKSKRKEAEDDAAQCLRASPESSPTKSEKNESSDCSDFEQTELLQEAELENVSSAPSSPGISPALQSQPARDKSISMVRGRPYRKGNVNNVKQPSANSKVFICDLCGHQSTSPKNLEIHILRHKGEKNFECEECGIKHYSKYLLQLHIRVKHHGEMPYLCKYCDQRFYSASTRQRHEQVRHIRSWSYECKLCGKRYNTKSCLNKHEFLHTGLRPYRCDLCDVAFPRKPGLRMHCRTKLHQKRASEALNSQIDDMKEITMSDNTIVFPDSMIVELDG